MAFNVVGWDKEVILMFVSVSILLDRIRAAKFCLLLFFKVWNE